MGQHKPALASQDGAPEFVGGDDLVLCHVEHGAVEVFGLGEGGGSRGGLAGDEGVHGGEAADGGVEQ